MEKDCRAYNKEKNNVPQQPPKSKFSRIIYVSSLMNKMECLKFRNIGHMDHDCNLIWVPKKAKTITTKHERRVTQVWKRKQTES